MPDDDSQRVAKPNAQRDAASYLADMTRELALVAKAHRLDFLAHLLEIARLEAATLADEQRGARLPPKISAQ